VKVMATAVLLFTAIGVIGLLRGDDEDKVNTGKPMGRSRRELMEAVSQLPVMLAIGIILWLVWGARVFDNAIIDALQKYHAQGYR